MYSMISNMLEGLAIELTTLGAQHFKDKIFQCRDIRISTLFVQEDGNAHYIKNHKML